MKTSHECSISIIIALKKYRVQREPPSFFPQIKENRPSRSNTLILGPLYINTIVMIIKFDVLYIIFTVSYLCLYLA